MGATFTVDCHTAINSYFMACSTVIRRLKQMAARVGGGGKKGISKGAEAAVEAN